MRKDVLDAILAMGRDTTLDVDGRAYATVPLQPVAPASPKAIELATLLGLITFCQKDPDGWMPKAKVEAAPAPALGASLTEALAGTRVSQVAVEPDVPFLHVVSHDVVELSMPTTGPWYQRRIIASASSKGYGAGEIRLGHQYDQEQFVISVQAAFAEGADKARVLAVAGNATATRTTSGVDDGVTQTIARKAGVTLESKDVVPNRVRLAPFRTFREVDQPTSEYVLRAHYQESSPPKFSLWAADGDAWKLEAVKRVQAYLSAALPDMVVLA